MAQSDIPEVTIKSVLLRFSWPYTKSLAFKDIKKAEVKTVQMGCKKYKILSLIPKEKVKYSYNWLQKHNCTFGPFAIALYGIMTPEDEKEIVKIVKSKVSK